MSLQPPFCSFMPLFSVERQFSDQTSFMLLFWSLIDVVTIYCHYHFFLYYSSVTACVYVVANTPQGQHHITPNSV